MRRMFSALPQSSRFAFYRWMVDCDPEPDLRLELKIAETKEELEACFSILHDAYVASGFMEPDPSGMRITIYHALPTTTTLCAKYDGRVVGTISMIREGVFGFPLQSIFDLTAVRAKEGNIAEISALAVHPEFRKTGGAILFPLMKFMREYCSEYFDTRHLVIAVNPEKIELYEALLFFDRLQAHVVDKYDFANGAPAVGATLDLKFAADIFRRCYGGRSLRKNLHKYFFMLRLENIKWPKRRYFTTNDPVMTPELLDYFFNKKSPVLERLDDRKKALLWSIYNLYEYRSVLPMLSGPTQDTHPLRRHQRYSIRCPGQIEFGEGTEAKLFVLEVIEISFSGFQAQCKLDLPLQKAGVATIELGGQERSCITATAVRQRDTETGVFYGFKIDEPDAVWRACVSALEMGQTHQDLT
ncbi:GNAT family N-acetyltransferase [Paucibacter sp. APW11]|uniref:GNAT family N-acetyltransferase n=1 Tax=Roseateles aquae TaxID=3077235 RepID=A0ABU3P764_9BURK|nr:GNAT family N-acetyltransferase [Paucibacter sp. APW11]MDT8997958.1 GNAT family N-acetyltransferase [Paucibacter sp. APW11]